VRDWLSRADRDAKEARDTRILEAWMACETQEAIADAEGLDKAAISRICCEMADLPKLNKSERALAEHAADYDPPLYNVWRFKQKTNEVGHFGNSEPTIVDHLFYLYTEPFDVVADPFAGSGSTRDVCRKRWRRYWVSDRHVPVELQDRVREWDITDGLPPLPRWKDVRLVYLDPPYWKQAEGRYSDDPQDLANMPLERFTETLASLILGFAGKLHAGAHIALLMQSTQWNAPDRRYTDHVADLIRSVELPIEMRVQCPYESQQCTPQMVNWARENRQILVLSRELVVWRV